MIHFAIEINAFLFRKLFRDKLKSCGSEIEKNID